jgi:hypothetical protein
MQETTIMQNAGGPSVPSGRDRYPSALAGYIRWLLRKGTLGAPSHQGLDVRLSCVAYRGNARQSALLWPVTAALAAVASP